VAIIIDDSHGRVRSVAPNRIRQVAGQQQTREPISIRPEPRRVFVSPSAPPVIQQQIVQQRTPQQEVTPAQLTQQEAQRRIVYAQTIVAPPGVRYQYEGDNKQYTPQEIRSNLIRAGDQRQPYFNYLQQQREQQRMQEERYRPMKEEFEKIDTAYKVFPPLGFLGELGYGAVSSAKSFGVGIYNIATGSNLYEPSLFDLGFEKEGAKIWGIRPVFTAGSVFGETAQFFVGGQIGKYAAKGIGMGIKAIPKAKFIPTIAGKMSPVLSKSRFVGFASDALSSISESAVSKNFNLWSKGYKPVSVAVPVAAKPAVKTITTFGRQAETKLKYLSIKRQFVSPETFQAAKTNFNKLLNTRNIDIGFPSVKESGWDTFILGTYTKEYYGTKGILKKTLIKKGLYEEYSRPIESFRGKLKWTGEQYELYASSPPSKTTMFTNEGFTKTQSALKPVKDISRIGDVSTNVHMYRGYRFTPFRTGRAIETTMKGYQPELNKKWITKIQNRKAFLKGEEATQPLLARPEIKLNKIRASYGGTELQRYGTTAINIPVGESGTMLGYLGMYSPKLIKYTKPIQIQKFIPIQMNDAMVKYIQNTRQESKYKNSFADKTISDTMQRVEKAQRLQQITQLDTYKPSLPKAARVPYEYFRAPVSFKPYLWSLPSEHGGGGGQRGIGKDYLIGYRVRKWRVPHLEDYFKKWSG